MSRALRSSPLELLLGLSFTCPLLACGPAHEPIASVRAASALPETILINEIEVDPPGADGAHEYVELIGPARAELRSHRLIALEADLSDGRLGAMDWTADLDTACDGGVCSLGSNGLLMLAAPDGHAAMDQETVVAFDPALEGGGLENGSLVLLLVRRDPLSDSDDAQDWDTNDDCALDLPSGVDLLDAVGWLDGDPGDCPYVAALLAAERPSAASRFDGETCAPCTEAWFSGRLNGSSDSLGYSRGWSLTPGGLNPPRPSSTSVGAGTAGNASLSSASADQTPSSGAGGQAGSRRETDPKTTAVTASAAGAGHWRSPPLTVALGTGHGGNAGAHSDSGPTAGATTIVTGCAFRAAGIPVRPTERWLWTYGLCWLVGAHPRRRRVPRLRVA